MKVMRCFTLSVLLLCLSSLASAITAEEVVARARSYLGTEEALNRVESLSFRGTVTNRAGDRVSTMSLELMSPNFQKMTIVNQETYSVTVVNAFEGLTRVHNLDNPSLYTIAVLPPDRVEFLRANSLENLNFFRGAEVSSKAALVLNGETIKRGRPVYRLESQYPNVTYTRFFDRENGQLIATRISQGDYELVEQDYFQVEGIRFPRHVLTYSPDGHLLRTVTFEEIIINPKLTVEDFTLTDEQILGVPGQ